MKINSNLINIALGFKITLRNMSYKTDNGVALESIVNYLNKFAPRNLVENWDNTGLLVEPQTKKNVENILLTNDLTEDVMKEALDTKADMIISYHPPIFKPLKSITTSTWKERIVGTCIENKIAIYSPHTSWDSVPGGINDWLASAFDVVEAKPIIRKNESEIENAGIGRYCNLKKEMSLSNAVNNVKSLIKQPFVQIALARGASLDTEIKDIAICAGSGNSVLENFPAQLYITGEMSHHILLDSIHRGSSVILCNHSNSERGFLNVFKQKLRAEFGRYNVKVFVSSKDKDPLQFVI